jgi:hypothetical protein
VDQPGERFGGARVARMVAHVAEQFLPDRTHPGDIRARREAAAQLVEPRSEFNPVLAF